MYYVVLVQKQRNYIAKVVQFLRSESDLRIISSIML